MQVYEISYPKKENDIRSLIISKAPFYDLDGTISGIVALLIDITEIRRAEQQLREANATKAKIFSIVGHDLRGPIGSFKSMLEILVSSPDSFRGEKLQKVLRLMQASANRTLTLLENLLYWAKSQRGEIEYSPQVLDLNEIAGDNIALLLNSAHEKGIKFHSHIKSNTSAFGDKIMVNTVFRNLISNAIKFTPEKGKIIISAAGNQQWVEIAVQDTGVGIAEKDLPKIFDKRYHFVTDGTADEKGSGLGLLLCRDFVEQHGGKIWVESQQGQGSTFKFTLPGGKPQNS